MPAAAYRIERTLGGGASGVVYLARQVDLDRPVAIKELSPSLAQDGVFLARFRVEAQVMARLDHPNCVRVYEYVEDGPAPWLVCEYVDGASLEVVAHTAGRLSPEQALAVVKGALNGLAHAHGLGLTHRDIKPANLIADRAGVSKLADFGLAAPVTAEDAAGQPQGSPPYMSPEQVQGRQVDARSDIYSCGAMLFELLTGQTPYVAEGALAMMRRQVSDPVPDPREADNNVPPAVAAMVMRAMDKDPALRQQTPAAFLAELEAAAAEAYGPDWEKRGSIASLVSVAAAVTAGAGATAAAGAATIGAATVTAGAGTAATASAASAATGFTIFGIGALPLAIGGVLAAAVIGGGALAYAMGVFGGSTAGPTALSSPSAVPLVVPSPTAEPLPSPSASPSPSPIAQPVTQPSPRAPPLGAPDTAAAARGTGAGASGRTAHGPEPSGFLPALP